MHRFGDGGSLESTAEGQALIEGVYGPNEYAWSLYLYGYLIIGSLGLFSGILGFCQWMLAAGVTLYLVAQFGQKLGAWQIYLVHRTYDAALGGQVEAF